jgi:hypothetical protein
MTEVLPPGRCQHGRACDRAPCFQARLEAMAGRRPVRQRAELCADHLGDAVLALATWAREQGLEGTVTVLAIDQAEAGQAEAGQAAGPPWPGDQGAGGFVFATISVSP